MARGAKCDDFGFKSKYDDSLVTLRGIAFAVDCALSQANATAPMPIAFSAKN